MVKAEGVWYTVYEKWNVVCKGGSYGDLFESGI